MLTGWTAAPVRRRLLAGLVAMTAVAAVNIVSAPPAHALSMGFLTDLAVGRMQNGRLEVYGIDSGRYVWHNTQVAANAGWGGWVSLDPIDSNGASLSLDDSLSVGTNSDGRLELFAHTDNYTMYHIWQTAPSGNYATWGVLGANLTDLTGSPAVARDGCGHLQVFSTSDLGLSYLTQSTPAQGWDTIWTELNVPHNFWRGGPVVTMDAQARLEVFGVDNTGTLFNVYQTEPCGTTFHYSDLGVTLQSGLAVGNYADGRIVVGGIGTDGKAYLKYQTTAGGNWSGWVGLGGSGLTRNMAIARNSDGRMEVFAFNGSGALYHTYEHSPGGTWSGFTSLGTLPNQVDLEVGQNADGRLEVFALNFSQGKAYHLYQRTTGGWSAWAAL